MNHKVVQRLEKLSDLSLRVYTAGQGQGARHTMTGADDRTTLVATVEKIGPTEVM